MKGSRTRTEAQDYTLSFKNFLQTEFSDDLDTADILKNFAVGVFTHGELSYKYRPGDQTFFEVAYKFKSSGPLKTFAFVTGDSPST